MPTHSNIAIKLNRGPLSHVLTSAVRTTPVNDNSIGKSTNPVIVEAALRHFAEHGLSAARAARHKAEQAFFANEQVQYRHWIEVCRQLDQRMAKIAERELSA